MKLAKLPIDRAGIQRLSAHNSPTSDGAPTTDDTGSYGTEADDDFLSYLKKGSGVVNDVVSIFSPKENSAPKPTANARSLDSLFGSKTLLYAGAGVLVLVLVLFVFKKK